MQKEVTVSVSRCLQSNPNYPLHASCLAAQSEPAGSVRSENLSGGKEEGEQNGSSSNSDFTAYTGMAVLLSVETI